MHVRVNERNLFPKLERQTNSKDKRHLLNVKFLDTFCICSRKKWGETSVCALLHPILHTFDTTYDKNLQSLALQGLGEIFTHAI